MTLASQSDPSPVRDGPRSADRTDRTERRRIPTTEMITPLPRLAAVPRDAAEIASAEIGTESLQPAVLAGAIVFVAFALYHWLALSPGQAVPQCIYDVALCGLCVAVFVRSRRSQMSQRGFHLATAAVSLGVFGEFLVGALLNANPRFSQFDSLVLIATCVVIVSPRWAIAITAVELTGWAVVAYRVLPTAQLALDGFLMTSCVAIGFIIYAGRLRARDRILELRAGDARRELALQEALAEADEARRGLDRKVEERTAALRDELEERQRLEEQLRHAQKLEAVGRLAGGIAHDFNNLLTVIRMSHTTIAEPDTSAGDLGEAIRDATDATDRAAALTHDLLAFARKQTLQPANVAVAEILGGVERMIRRVTEAGIRVEVRAADAVGDVLADRHQIEQVLLNLAINACDAMGSRGTLTIAADAIELPTDDAGPHRVRPGTYVRIAVTDTGTGMDEATRRSVFEPFFTTKEVGRGTGLGLAVAHGIVTQHGGQIDVDSELGRGSTFTVLLPRARGRSQRNTVSVVRPLASLAHETVLVVEDEAAVRRAVQRNLERLGYRVIAACDGEDALRQTGTLDGIDLLLTDVVMPGIDGPELACRLRDRWSGLPVLFVTGYSADRLARTGAVGPHDRVLEKPYQPVDLARTIREMLEARAARPAAS